MNKNKCKCEKIRKEGWIDMDGEYRHVEYLYCPKCDSIYALDGELLFTGTRLVLTSDRK